MNTKIITPGEKIRDLRKLYKIKQHEITGDKITRNMISMIETDKAGLTEATAKVLVENITRICKEKGIKVDISLDYLMESGEEQANKVADEFINIFDKDYKIFGDKEYETYINDLEEIIEKYKLKKKKYAVYERLGWLNMNSFKYYRAYTYYVKAFQNCSELFNNIELINTIINITFCCGKLNLYKEGIDFIRLAFIYMNKIPDEMLYTLKYNNICFLKKSGDYDQCLKEIEELEPFFKDKEFYDIKKAYILMLKANCLKEKNLYNSAIEVHEEILELCKEDVELQLVTFCNILEIYMELNDTKNISKYLDKCIFALKPYKTVEKKSFLPDIYHGIAQGYYAIEQFKMSKDYFHEALGEARSFSKKTIIVSCLRRLLDIAISEKCEEDIFKLKNTLMEIISLEILPPNHVVVFDFISYFNSIKDTNTVADIIGFVKKNFKEEEEE